MIPIPHGTRRQHSSLYNDSPLANLACSEHLGLETRGQKQRCNMTDGREGLNFNATRDAAVRAKTKLECVSQ